MQRHYDDRDYKLDLGGPQGMPASSIDRIDHACAFFRYRMEADDQAARLPVHSVRTMKLSNQDALRAATQVAREMLGLEKDAPLRISQSNTQVRWERVPNQRDGPEAA